MVARRRITIACARVSEVGLDPDLPDDVQAGACADCQASIYISGTSRRLHGLVPEVELTCLPCAVRSGSLAVVAVLGTT